MKIILRVIKEFVIVFEQLLAFFPGTMGGFFRRTYYNKLFGELGNKYSSGIGVEILGAKNISLGNNIFLGNYSVLHAHNGGKIIISDDVWIGANVVILPDVTIGTHSVIAAGSVVTKDIEPYTVAAGVPAKTIKKLDIELG